MKRKYTWRFIMFVDRIVDEQKLGKLESFYGEENRIYIFAGEKKYKVFTKTVLKTPEEAYWDNVSLLGGEFEKYKKNSFVLSVEEENQEYQLFEVIE
jgi:hypothetical protein